MESNEAPPLDRRLFVLSPTMIFLSVFVVFQLAPGLYLYLFDVEENLYGELTGNYSDAALLYVTCVGLFLLSFATVRYLVHGHSSFTVRRFTNLEYTVKLYWERPELLRLPRQLILFSVVAVLIYLVTGGYEKIVLMGSATEASEYRLIGYDDRPRWLTAGLEISRRVFLPIGILYYLTLKRVGAAVSTWWVGFLVSIQLLAAVMTMDRAPFLVLLVLIAYSYISGLTRLQEFVRLAAMSIAATVLLAGVTTNLQYNIVSFSLPEVIGMGWDFVIHRTWLVPSIAPIELSFGNFDVQSRKLLLEHSRLGALFTGTYVGTSEENSIFVTPVGAVGDIWRNFGFTGIVAVGALLGHFFHRLDQLTERVSAVSSVVGTFLVIALCFYWVMGVFFSQGAIFTMLVTYMYLQYESRIFNSETPSFLDQG